MTDKNLFEMCVRMFEERARAHDRAGGETQVGMASAYANAAQMLKYAIDGNYECLAQFDYFHEDTGEG